MKNVMRSVVKHEFDSQEVIVASINFWTPTLLLKRNKYLYTQITFKKYIYKLNRTGIEMTVTFNTGFFELTYIFSMKIKVNVPP